MARLHLGSAEKIHPGYINCDVRPLPGVDKVFDFEHFPWPIASDTIEHIISQDVLEHLSWRIQPQVFREIHRILRPGGTADIAVPDIGRMCHAYVDGTICACVPHKAKAITDYSAASECVRCNGLGTVNPMRWLLAFVGAQKHPWDIHRTVFTREYLEELAKNAHLTVVKYGDNPYKIVVTLAR